MANRKLADFIFSKSWPVDELNFSYEKKYVVLQSIGNLKVGNVVTFCGFEDIDNPYGIAVFRNAKREIIEYPGDYSGRDSSIF
jgi:hypothetical protein